MRVCSFLNSVNMATVLTRLQVQDVDAGAATSASATLFVRCRQKALSHSGSAKSSSNGVRLPALQLDVAEGDALWRGEVTEEHKPMVLDCSAGEYLSTLEAVFNVRATIDTAAAGGVSARRAFVYKWSRKSGVLTLMEESASRFAMKYTSITLSRVRDNEDEKQAIWQSLLQEIVDVGAHATQEMKRQRVRIEALEALLKEKDAVLETALQAKQQLEDQLFEGFCAVLNTKKDEIQRLQHELVVTQMQMQTGGGQSNGKSSSSSSSKKEPRQPRVTKAKGAKLKRKAVVNDDDEDEEEQGSSSEEEEAESHDNESGSQGDDDEGDDDSADNKRSSRRAKRGAIDAYSQLPSDIRSSSQVYSADDVLSNLDAIIKQENEANVAIQEGAGDSNSNGRSKAKRPRSTAPPVRRTQDKKQKSEASSQEDEADEKKKSDVKSQESKVKPAAPVPPPRAPPAPAMDSEEEDLFDMLT